MSFETAQYVLPPRTRFLSMVGIDRAHPCICLTRRSGSPPWPHEGMFSVARNLSEL